MFPGAMQLVTCARCGHRGIPIAGRCARCAVPLRLAPPQPRRLSVTPSLLSLANPYADILVQAESVKEEQNREKVRPDTGFGEVLSQAPAFHGVLPETNIPPSKTRQHARQHPLPVVKVQERPVIKPVPVVPHRPQPVIVKVPETSRPLTPQELMQAPLELSPAQRELMRQLDEFDYDSP